MPSSFRKMLSNFISGEETSDDSDVESPPIVGAKRKASDELIRPRKSRRYTRPQFTAEDYANSDFWEGAVERRTSRATQLPGGTNTQVVDLESESGFATPEPATFFSIYGRKKSPVRRGSPGKRASPERVRQGRLKFLDLLPSRLGNALGGVQDVVEETHEAGIHDTRLDVDLDHARKALEHAREEVEGVQAMIEASTSPALPVDIHQPGPEPERAATPVPAVLPTRSQSADSPWTDAPNARARRIIRQTASLADAATRIKAELTEPEYAYRDMEVRDTMWHIMDEMEDFARTHFGGTVTRNKKDLAKVFRKLEPETVKIIGCVASGGPGGED